MASEGAISKVDSAISGLSSSPRNDKHDSAILHESETHDSPSSPQSERHVPTKKRTSSSAPGVMNINDLEKEGVEIAIAKETQKLNWKLNTSPTTVEDREVLKKMLTTPPIKKIDLHFPLGLEVSARNLKGVTIKDALDAIHKQFKKKADDELENPILAGFEWDKEESWTRLIVHQKKEGAPPSKKSKKKGDGD